MAPTATVLPACPFSNMLESWCECGVAGATLTLGRADAGCGTTPFCNNRLVTEPTDSRCRPDVEPAQLIAREGLAALVDLPCLCLRGCVLPVVRWP